MTAPAEYLILKRGLYYRPDGSGYTGIKEEAGRYALSETAVRFPQCDDSGLSFIHENDAPEFSPACWDETKDYHRKKKADAMSAVVKELVEALAFYEAVGADCRKITGEGDAARNALQQDGGDKARAALKKVEGL